MPRFGKKSKRKLSSCEDELQRLFEVVVYYIDCTIIEGHRGKEKQDAAYAFGRSKVKFPDSNHNSKPSRAVDVMPYYPDKPHIRWDLDDQDTAKDFFQFVGFVKGTAAQMGIKVRWGGDFKGFFDGPHWELVD